MPASIADLDSAGESEVVVGAGKLSVFRYSDSIGQFQVIWSGLEENGILQISSDDVDGDGRLEAVYASAGSAPGRVMIVEHLTIAIGYGR